jgi:hypothetical protein
MSFMRPREAITNKPSDSAAIRTAPDVYHQSTRFSQKDRPFECTQYAVTTPPKSSASESHQTYLRTFKSGKSASSCCGIPLILFGSVIQEKSELFDINEI